MYKNNTILLFILSIFLGFSSISSAESHYFLCGPDEDRCFLDELQFCACIPYNDIYGTEPYCLNLNTLTCAPVALVPNCDPNDIYPTQNQCISMLFHSVPTPGCLIVPGSFCTDNHVAMCEADGNPFNCKR